MLPWRFVPVIATRALTAGWIAFHLPLMVTKPDRYGPGWVGPQPARRRPGQVPAVRHERRQRRAGDGLPCRSNTATAAAVGSLPEAHRPTSWFATGIVWFAAGLLLELASLAAGARRRLSSR
jgi:hypothetical protein